jgi:hypothetical protein
VLAERQTDARTVEQSGLPFRAPRSSRFHSHFGHHGGSSASRANPLEHDRQRCIVSAAGTAKIVTHRAA